MRPNLIVMNREFETVAVIDVYQSLIWNDKYAEAGDFEVTVPITAETLSVFQPDNYCIQKNTDRTMIIQSQYLRSDVTAGGSLLIKGYSLEAILKRRIAWGLNLLQGNLQDAIRDLLVNNIIAPGVPSRRISNFRFERNEDPRITSLNIEIQSTGENIYDLITRVCKDYDLGYKVLLDGSNNFVFSLYYGENRSYTQDKNPYVVFSPAYDTLPNSQHIYSEDTWRNAAQIGGEGEGWDRRYEQIGDATGLDRREIFVDARDISSRVDNDTNLSNDEYNAILRQRGWLKLQEYPVESKFDADINDNTLYTYGVDFNLGDKVQVDNNLGISGEFRMTELVMTYDAIGESVIPTFSGAKR